MLDCEVHRTRKRGLSRKRCMDHVQDDTAVRQDESGRQDRADKGVVASLGRNDDHSCDYDDSDCIHCDNEY